MKAKRIIGCLAAVLLLAGCFKEVGYKTSYVLKPLSQQASGDVISPIEGAQAFAYNVDTTLWTVASYEDALNGIITLKENPSERQTEPAAVASPYEKEGAAGWLQMPLSKHSQMVVVVDPASRLYAYTQQKLSENVPTLYVSLVFRLWKEGNSYQDGGQNTKWSFYNDFYVPPVSRDCFIQPEVQYADGGETAPVASGKVNAYAYIADTTSWRLASYNDALKGIITSKSDPDLQRSSPNFQGYKQSDSDLYKITLTSSEPSLTLMLVVVDQADKMYAYTEKTVELAGESLTFAIVFRPWMQAWITEEEGWQIVDESKAPATETTATPIRK